MRSVTSERGVNEMDKDVYPAAASLSGPLTPMPESRVAVVQIEQKDRAAAAARLMADQHPDPYHAGERFLQAASALKLDLRWFWGVPDATGVSEFSQVLLAIIGSGRTAMLFLSPAAHSKGLWRSLGRGMVKEESVRARLERVTLLERAITSLGGVGSGSGTGDGGPGAGSIALVQALLEPPAGAVGEAFEAGGFLRLGDLAYLRKPFVPTSVLEGASLHAGVMMGPWPKGVEVLSLAALLGAGEVASMDERIEDERVDAMLIRALERSYIDTLDCPELCGLRTIEDVLVSHKGVGQLDPRLWWLVLHEGQAAGCVMFTPVRETDSVELVYLGLGPELRGLGLGKLLLREAIEAVEVWWHSAQRRANAGAGASAGASDVVAASRVGNLSGGITLAVDVRNVPALKLYRAAGFVRSAVRVPFVRSV